MHSDKPTTVDKLNRRKLAEKMAEQICDCDCPQTFGVHGDWGAGKTSFLGLIREELDGTTFEGLKETWTEHQNDVVTVWFDAWKYQHESSPIIALLHELRRQLGLWAKARDMAGKLSEITARTILNSFTDIGKIIKLESLSADKIQKSGEQWEKEHLMTKLGTDTVSEFLEKAVKSLLSNLFNLNSHTKKRLVIFIDDLDRCIPESAFRLLEGLKVYLNIESCVFVLGVNQQQIVEMISQCVPSTTPNKIMRAEAYLEKICSDFTRLIPVNRPETLLIDWLDEDIIDQFKEALNKDTFSDMTYLPPNPRKLKSLANRINGWKGHIDKDTKEDIYSLTIIAYIYQFHSELFNRWQFTPQFYTHIKSWTLDELGIIPDKPDTKERDLPDYFKNLDFPTGKKGSETTSMQEIMQGIIQKYPDPHAQHIFWIAPLIQMGLVKEKDINPILSEITANGESDAGDE